MQKPPKLWPRTLQRSTSSSCRMSSASRTIEIGAEVGQVFGLRLGGLTRDVADGRRPASAALVQEQDSVVLERPLDPAGRGRGRARSFVARASLQEHEEWPGLATDGRDLAGEDGDRSPVPAGVVQRHHVLALGENDAGCALGDGHRSIP